MFVEEKQRRRGMVLRGRGDVSLDGLVDEKVADVPLIEVCQMGEIMKANGAPDLTEVDLLGIDAQRPRPAGMADVTEQLRTLSGG